MRARALPLGSLVFLQLYWCPARVLSLLYVPGQTQVLQSFIVSQHLQQHSSATTTMSVPAKIDVILSAATGRKSLACVPCVAS
jgi:hypothetical protein